MESLLEKLILRFEKDSRPDLRNKISITWVCYKDPHPEPFSGIGAGWLEEKFYYPASVVKLFYACALEAWLMKDILVDSFELRRALSSMIVDSSNDATSYIVDLLTATTSGPSLQGERWEVWKRQRNLINDWLLSLDCKEFKSINCCQKTWSDGPFGRDRDFYGGNYNNRNSLNTIGTARFFESLMTGTLLPLKATKNLKTILFRSLDLMKRKANPENQVDGFLGEGLPKGSKLWSKAGLMSEARHDASWFFTPKGKIMLLIVFTTGQELAKDTFLLPAIAAELSQWNIS